MEVKDGQLYIINVHSKKGWLGFSIRLIEHIKFGKYAYSNHSAFLCQDKGIWYVWEAEAQGVIKTEWNKWNIDSIKTKDFTLSVIPDHYKITVNSQLWANYANESVGEGYDYYDLLFVQPIDILTGIELSDNNNTKTICSRYCAKIEKEFTVGIISDDNICPAELYKINSKLK